MPFDDYAVELLRREINDVRVDCMREIDARDAALAVLTAEIAEMRAMHTAPVEVIDVLTDDEIAEIEADADAEIESDEGIEEAEAEAEAEVDAVPDAVADEAERIMERIEDTEEDVRPERRHPLHYNVFDALRNR